MTDIIMLSGGLGSWMAGILRRRNNPALTTQRADGILPA